MAGAQGVPRPRPLPGRACRHRQEVPGDVRVPRPLLQDLEPQPHRARLPAGRGDRPQPAAGGALRRAQDHRPQERAGGVQVQGHHRRHPPRRAGDPRQGARVLAARRKRRLELPRPAAGILGPFQERPAGRRAYAHPSAAELDRARHLALHRARADPDRRSLLLARTASATARSATRTSPRRSSPTPPASARSSSSCRNTKTSERAGRAMDHEREDAFERLRAQGYM